MTDIRFYHLEQSTLDQALPSITQKAWQSGARVLIKTPDKKEAKRIGDHLWTYNPQSFLPHGTEGDKLEDKHPILVTHTDENKNNATILILTHGCTTPDMSSFDMCCEMLDGRVESQIKAARTRWKEYKDAEHTLTYWQQDENGKWHKK